MQDKALNALAFAARARQFHYALVSTATMAVLIATAAYLGALVR
ncbi:hypothetical protein [Afifella pfennigii]|nr:hypothetical protein [Afifella pfennigii]